jgi:hypothetical protein
VTRGLVTGATGYSWSKRRRGPPKPWDVCQGVRSLRSLIYDLDVAKAVPLALEHPSAPGHTYNVTDGKVHTVDEIISAICEARGRRPPRFRLPAAPCLIMARATDRIGALLMGSPFGLSLALRTYWTTSLFVAIAFNQSWDLLPITTSSMAGGTLFIDGCQSGQRPFDLRPLVFLRAGRLLTTGRLYGLLET